MLDISWDGYLFTQPDSSFYFAQLQLDFAKEKGQKKHIAKALNTQGVSFYMQGNYTKAIDYYTKSLKIREEIGDKKGIASSLNNIGGILLCSRRLCQNHRLLYPKRENSRRDRR